MKLHAKGFWFSKSFYNNPKQVTKNVTKKGSEKMKDKNRTETLERVTRDVILRISADNDLLMFLDRDRDNISRYNALRGLILEFMGTVANDAYRALDRDKAKKVYRMYDHMSTGLQRAERMLMEHMDRTVRISNDEL